MGINKRIKDLFIVVFIFLVSSVLIGCAEINLFEAPSEVLKHPLGTDLIRLGMTKNEVISIWGKPDQTNQLEPSDEWNMPREEWVYIGRYSKIPLDRSYLFKTKYLIFEGDNVIYIGEESRSEAGESEE